MKPSVLSIVTFALAQTLMAVCAFGGIWEGKSVSRGDVFLYPVFPEGRVP